MIKYIGRTAKEIAHHISMHYTLFDAVEIVAQEIAEEKKMNKYDTCFTF